MLLLYLMMSAWADLNVSSDIRNPSPPMGYGSDEKFRSSVPAYCGITSPFLISLLQRAYGQGVAFQL